MQDDHEFAIRAEEGTLKNYRSEYESSLRFDGPKYLRKLRKENLQLGQWY